MSFPSPPLISMWPCILQEDSHIAFAFQVFIDTQLHFRCQYHCERVSLALILMNNIWFFLPAVTVSEELEDLNYFEKL